MRFAYLIPSYNNYIVLQMLVGLIDDPRNDIYIHFDKKVSIIPQLNVSRSKLYILKDRIDVRWGTVSQIEYVYKLFHSAIENAEYDYYFIVSGTHLPVKSQDYIHHYFDNLNGASILRIYPHDDGESKFKMQRFHFGIRNYQSNIPIVRWSVQHIWTLNMFLQRIFNIQTNKGITFTKAEVWGALSHSAISYLIHHEKDILSRYRFSFCGDEYYLATELLSDKQNVVKNDYNILFVEFNNEHPQVLCYQDFKKLQKSSYLFARKFNDASVQLFERS